MTNTTSSQVSVTYVYTVSANGCTNPITYNVVVVVYPKPTLSSSLTPPAICSNTLLNYLPVSATTGATFSWTRAVVAGISNIIGSGTGNSNETLINTTVNPVNVTYVYSVSANGCTNATPYNVVVTVNPTPILSSTLAPPAICSGTTFNYVPSSATAGASFNWNRPPVTGISQPSASGSGDPNEVLTTLTTFPNAVTYNYTITANGCSNTQSVIVTVNPNATLSSSLTPPDICGGTAFSYTPTSATVGTTYSWTRAAVAGISNVAANGVGAVNETLNDTTGFPVNVTYVYTASANGCSNPTTFSVVVKINPAPELTSTLTPPAICNGTPFYYLPTSSIPGAMELVGK